MYKNVKWYKNKMFLRNENSFIFLKDVEFMKKCLFYFEINLYGYFNCKNLFEFFEEF